MVKFLEASISMNNNRMDESVVSAPVASPADYILYSSLALDHLVSTSIDAYAAIITAHLPPNTPCAESITVKTQQQPLYKCDPSN